MTSAATLRTARENHIRLAHAAAMEPADHQEAHSPTVAVIGHDGKPLYKMREIDQRLFANLTTEQCDAIYRIRGGIELRCGQTSIRVSNYEGRIGKSTNDDHAIHLVMLERRFAEWVYSCKAAGLDAGAAIDVIYHGVSLNAVDAAKRKRKGWARGNLLAALNLYCRARGWAEGDTGDEAEAA